MASVTQLANEIRDLLEVIRDNTAATTTAVNGVKGDTAAIATNTGDLVSISGQGFFNLSLGINEVIKQQFATNQQLQHHTAQHDIMICWLKIIAKLVDIARRRGLPSASFVVADLAAPLDFLADDSFDVVVAGLVLHYLEDWVAPLKELRRVLRDTGTLVFSTNHPTADMEISKSGDYFATELLHDRWTKGDRTFDVSFWRRPLTAMFEAIAEAGFRVDRLTEPRPLEECRDRFPEEWKRLTTEPWFVTPGMGVLPKNAPDTPESVSVRFEKGRPVAFNGKKVTAFEASGIGIASSGVPFAIPGMKRSSVMIRNTALAAMAPLKPATKDVQPVRKPARGPNASRR